MTGPVIPVDDLPKLKCGSCTTCCKGDAPPLVVGVDNPMLYITETDPKDGLLRIKRQANGDCLYLGEKGCTIYNIRPEVCRNLDCRGFALVAATRPHFMARCKADPQKWQTLLVGRQKLVELFSVEKFSGSH